MRRVSTAFSVPATVARLFSAQQGFFSGTRTTLACHGGDDNTFKKTTEKLEKVQKKLISLTEKYEHVQYKQDQLSAEIVRLKTQVDELRKVDIHSDAFLVRDTAATSPQPAMGTGTFGC